MYTLPNKQQMQPGQQFSIGDTTYPPNWLALASTSDLADAGIVYAPDPAPAPAPAPTPPTLAQVQAAQVLEITRDCELQLGAITSQYPPSEIASWDTQYAEAVAWTANNAAPTPLLSAIIAANGATMAAQAASVLAKAAQFKAISGAAIGKRQALIAQIEAITDTSAAGIAAVQAIVW